MKIEEGSSFLFHYFNVMINVFVSQMLIILGLELMKSAIFALLLIVGLNSNAISLVYQFINGSQLTAQYTPPDTGKPPEGDGSGSRT